jgi:hypothetical protein
MTKRLGPVKVKWVKVSNVNPDQGGGDPPGKKNRAFFQAIDNSYGYVEGENDATKLVMAMFEDKQITADDDTALDLMLAFSDVYTYDSRPAYGEAVAYPGNTHPRFKNVTLM